jgi:hypothetical protein
MRNPKTYKRVSLVVNQAIEAVHSSDIEKFLDSIEELEAVCNGERRCFFCNEPMTTKNIYSMFPQDDDICYCCLSFRCVGLLPGLGVD